MKISVAIATHNEEETITRCIKSVTGWADEVILVDGSSTDNTIEIAEKLGAKIFPAPHEEMFHKNKQLAIDKSKNPWILQLDADEVVSDELKKEIIGKLGDEQVTRNNESINGYWLPRKNYFLGRFLKKGGQYPDYVLRLFKSGKGHLPCKSVHEQIKVEGRTDCLKNPLLHYSYPDFAHYLEHFNLYTTIEAKELEAKKEKTNFGSCISYLLLKPLHWFLLTFIRHKGFTDGFAGFIFSSFSSLRYPVSYIKYWEIRHGKSYNEKILQ